MRVNEYIQVTIQGVTIKNKRKLSPLLKRKEIYPKVLCQFGVLMLVIYVSSFLLK